MIMTYIAFFRTATLKFGHIYLKVRQVHIYYTFIYRYINKRDIYVSMYIYYILFKLYR